MDDYKVKRIEQITNELVNSDIFKDNKKSGESTDPEEFLKVFQEKIRNTMYGEMLRAEDKKYKLIHSTKDEDIFVNTFYTINEVFNCIDEKFSSDKEEEFKIYKKNPDFYIRKNDSIVDTHGDYWEYYTYLKIPARLSQDEMKEKIYRDNVKMAEKQFGVDFIREPNDFYISHEDLFYS